MRSRLQLACHLLFISTIASSAPTPPTTDAAINENHNVEEDWMSVPYQPPTAEENHQQTMDATWTMEDAFKYAMEVSPFEPAASNNVLLEHQVRVEANQAQTIQARLEQEKATVDCIPPPASGRCGFCTKSESSAWHKGPYGVRLCNHCFVSLAEYKRMQALEEEKRAEILRLESLKCGVAWAEQIAELKGQLRSIDQKMFRCVRMSWIAPPASASGRCGFCRKSESSALHEGPYGVRLCNHCCLSLPEYKRMQALAEEKRAEILRLESLICGAAWAEQSRHSDLKKDGNIASSSTSAHKSSLKLPQLEDLPDAPFASQYPHHRNHAEGSRNGKVVEESMETRMYEPVTGEANRIDAMSLLSTVPLSPCVAHTSQDLPPSSDPMIAASSFPGIPTLQTSKSGKTYSKHPRAILKRQARALEAPQKRAERQQADRNKKRATRAERRARVQEPNQIEGESSQKKSKS